MSRFALVVLFSCTVIFSGQLIAAKNDITVKDKPVILVVGDSISAAYGMETNQGWVSLLATKITQEKKPYQVINASISGDTSAGAVNRLLALLKSYQPVIVIIEIGGNDGLRGLSIKQLKKNLTKMVQMSQQIKAKVMIAGMRIPPNYGKRYTEAFYNVFKQISQQYSTAYIPFLLDGIGDNNNLMQQDGIHPTKQAQVLIMNTVWKELVNQL